MRARLGTLVVIAALLGGCSHSTETRTATPERQSAAPDAVHELVAGARLLGQRRQAARREAAAHFRRALEIDPTLWEAHYDLGVVARRDGDLPTAIREFEEARRRAPESETVALALAESLQAAGRSDDGRSVLEDCVRRHPDSITARSALATLHRETGHYSEALDVAREALVRDPTDVRGLVEVGRIYRAREQYDVADLVLRKALALVPAGEARGKATVWNEIGLLELARGDTQAAFTAFGEANAADPPFQPARRNQGAVLLRAGDFAGATEQYEALVRIDGDDLDAHVGLAIALRGQGQHARAKQELERVLEADPENLAAIFDLGILEADFLSQREAARDQFRRFLDLAPGRHPARATAERYVADITAELNAPPPAPAEEIPLEEETPLEKP